MRPIDVDNLKARLRNSYKRRESALRTLGISNEAKGIIDSLIDVIDEEPTVDSVKHAHWMTDDYEVSYTCSACGWAILFRKPTNYCPHCGAKMDEAIK